MADTTQNDGLEFGTLLLNGIRYTKETLQGRGSIVSIQSFTIDNNLNWIKYPIIGYDPTWTYKVYLGNKGDLDVLKLTDPIYDYEIKDDGCLYLWDYKWDGNETYLIVGFS